jgi:hypothetical protein
LEILNVVNMLLHSKTTVSKLSVRLLLPKSATLPITLTRRKLSSSGLFRLKDKVAIVTGSSSGLGQSIALIYAKEGAKVVCSNLTSTPDEKDNATHVLIQESGGKSIFVKTDVSEAGSMQDLVEQAVRQFGRVDM